MTELGAHTAGSTTNSVIQLPDSLVGYVANNLAVITGIIHLLLAPQLMGFDQTLGLLFLLNGLGFLGGVALYLTTYWRRPLYLVAAGYALVTFVAFFVYGGFDGIVTAFYARNSLNWNAVGAKAAELLFIACTLYLYSTES